MTVPTGDNGRDSNGRFAGGNSFARGNPHHRKAAQLRSALLAAIDEADIKAAVAALLQRAKSGDVIAIRELLDRSVGKSVASDLLARLERIEEALEGIGNV